MRKKREKTEFAPIGGIINNLLRKYRTESEGRLIDVWRLWDDAVGETIAENARPAAFKGSVLLVHVISPVWIHQLRFMKNDIIARLNDAIGRAVVEEIKFKIGPLERSGS